MRPPIYIFKVSIPFNTSAAEWGARMRVVIVILVLQLCVGLTSALYLAKNFQTILRISRSKPVTIEDIEAEMADWLNWLQVNYPGQINGYQNLEVIRTRRGMDIQFELMYEDTIEDLSIFFNQAYDAYNKFTIFTTFPGFRELEYVSLFGDPHLTLMFGEIKLCIDTKEGLNDILSLYHRPDLDVILNVDFDADKNEHRKEPGQMKWIQDVAYLSPEINIITNKNNIEVHNNTGDISSTKLKWAKDESFEIGNTFVNIGDRKMVIYRFPNNESMKPDINIEISKPGAGLNIHILNDDMGADAGFIATLKSHIADVVTAEDEGTLTTDFGQDITLENYKDQCWKIPNGGIDVFPNNDFNDFFMACLECKEPKALAPENP
ncbi:unnamed protein product [Owenia fusiformis]|uniref:Uncharacterized protein n=1 Tax=Owenia fusiformis TaxID=6347 RepID=A0A8S4NPT3_OWEFU|nr:unnamed protein product [Owenia fusiformis]